jgi:endogenous inhibitor of DNA gyrase (YacG/DUF329 family)
MQIRGPYTHTTGRLKGRRYVTIVNDDRSKTSKLYSRYLMEEHLGRTLGRDETVDHINRDKTDDRIENLRILSRAQHSSEDHVRVQMVKFTCSWCGGPGEQKARNLQHAARQGKAGPFCGKSCAGKYSKAVQMGEPLMGRQNIPDKRQYYYMDK